MKVCDTNHVADFHDFHDFPREEVSVKVGVMEFGFKRLNGH